MTHARVCLLLAVTAAVGAVAPSAYAADEPGDAAPTVRSVTFDRAAVAVDDGPAVIGVAADVALPAGASSVTVRLGDSAAPVTLYRVAGTAREGTWSGVVTAPAYAPPGPLAAYVDVSDPSGALTSTTATGPNVLDAAPEAPSRIAFYADADGGLRVEWAAPPANGGSPVEAYDVTAAPAPGSDPAALAVEDAVVAADARAVTFPNVSPATRYVVRVAARNAAGAGPAAVADATTPAAAGTVPDGPTSVVARPSSRTLRVDWVAPRSDGGTPVERYDVRLTPRSAVAAPPVVSVTAPGAVVGGLADGVTYDVTVTAVNALGASLPGAAAGTPFGVPAAPVLGTVSPGDGTAVVRWTPPPTSNGSYVSSYTVTSSTGATVTLPATARSVTMRGLANGTGVTFAVAAANAAGLGPSATSRSVVPRRPGRLSVAAQPATPVPYGTASSVTASLTVAGVGVSGERVRLLAQVRPSTAWRSVDEETTDADGTVRLRAVLPATAALRLHHLAGAVGAPDVSVRGVVVASRVSASRSTSRVRVGQAFSVRGSVTPAHPGATVRLQRYSSTGWLTVASGRLSDTSTYGLSWRPGTAGTYLMRVVQPAHSDHANGISARWHQYVEAETAADIAAQILADGGIKLERVHVSGIRDNANAWQNVVDVAAGRLARRSAYQNAPGGYTTLDRRLLRALRRMGAAGTVTVSEIAGGSHSRGSTHYYGRGLDISYVNGRHVAPGSGYRLAVDACKAFGAVRVFSPSYDPYGGHHNHVHCDW